MIKKATCLAVLLAVYATAASVAETETKPAAPGEEESWFEDRTAAAGVDRPHHTRSFKNPYAHIMEGYTALGASAAVADYNGDGFEDVFFTDSSESGKNTLYRNNGDFTFTDVAEKAGVAVGNDAANASANSLWFDYDNDGHPDLFVVRFGQNLLFHNRGDGTFEDVTEEAGLLGRRNAIAAIAFDHDRDGDLDLFVGSYFAPVDLFDPDTPRFFPESFETAQNGGGMTAWRNEGLGADGMVVFTDMTEAAGLVLSGWTLDLGHADADHDGDDDLYVAADFGTDSFFRNDGDGTFTDVTEESIGIDTKKGMNVDWGDYDNDGLFDVYVTNITDEYMKEGNFLWQNLGDLKFADVSRETGTHATGWGWAGKFFDYDNDSWLDLYVVNGWVSRSRDPKENYVLDIFQVIVNPEIDLADARNWPPMGTKTLSGYQRNSLFHNEGGIFRDEGARHGLDTIEDARGVALADFDHDGRIDLFVTNSGKPPYLWRNIAPASHWLQLLLTGTKSNRDAVGTRVRIEVGGEARVSFVNGGNGFASQSTRRVHFGLAENAKVDKVEILWPSGRRDEMKGVAADRIYELTEGETELRPWNVAYAGGRAAVEAGRWEKAVASFEAAIAAEPENLRYGTEYRQAVIAAVDAGAEKDLYDRAIAFFERLVADHPEAANAWLNYGFIHVDKIPVEGAITQVILANTSLGHFTTALVIEESWLGLYSRGHAYLFWPPIFGFTPDGVADLERAVEISQTDERKRPYYARAWAALGDGHWRLKDLTKAREVWKKGLEIYPDDPELKARVDSADDKALVAYLEAHYDTGNRVGTHLREIFDDQDAERRERGAER